MAFKITQLAKDLGIKSKEITELMTARGMECKTTQKTLTASEFDIIFGALTSAAQITGIDDYLFGDTYIPTKAPEKKEKPAKAEEAAAPKAEPEKKETVEKKPATDKKAAPEKKETEKKAEPEVKSAPKTEAAAVPPAKKEEKETKAAPTAAPARSDPRTYNIPQSLRARKDRAPRRA